MSNYLLATLAQELEERVEFFRNDLSTGSAKEYAEYKYICGIIRGLQVTKELIAEMSRKLEKDEDE